MIIENEATKIIQFPVCLSCETEHTGGNWSG
jgi:hypothetical protein